MITLSEITRWIGISEFELLLHAVALIVSTIILALKSNISTISYWHVFAPLFITSAFNCYFLFIILVRTVVEERQFKRAFSAGAPNFLRTIMICLFEILLCYKIDGDYSHGQVAVDASYATVFLPVWVWMLAVGFQACRLM